MKDFKLGDWHRILFGATQPSYLFEVIVRVAIIYIIILISMRTLGKRMSAQVSRSEVVARISLAAAVGLVIQRPQRGILGALVIAVIIVVVGRWLTRLAFRSERFEKAYLGHYTTLVLKGKLDLNAMNKTRITRERLFAALRAENIRHLGQVKKLFLEANGKFSLVRGETEVPGLSVIPEWDIELHDRQQKSSMVVCKNCGDRWNRELQQCETCKSVQSEIAIILP